MREEIEYYFIMHVNESEYNKLLHTIFHFHKKKFLKSFKRLLKIDIL